MDKRIYCIGKITNGNQEIRIAEGKDSPSKRISIVSVKLVRESSFLYKQRRITGPNEAYEMIREFLRKRTERGSLRTTWTQRTNLWP